MMKMTRTLLKITSITEDEAEEDDNDTFIIRYISFPALVSRGENDDDEDDNNEAIAALITMTIMTWTAMKTITVTLITRRK